MDEMVEARAEEMTNQELKHLLKMQMNLKKLLKKQLLKKQAKNLKKKLLKKPSKKKLLKLLKNLQHGMLMSIHGQITEVIEVGRPRSRRSCSSRNIFTCRDCNSCWWNLS
jgi:hypothetical protein